MTAHPAAPRVTYQDQGCTIYADGSIDLGGTHATPEHAAAMLGLPAMASEWEEATMTESQAARPRAGDHAARTDDDRIPCMDTAGLPAAFILRDGGPDAIQFDLDDLRGRGRGAFTPHHARQLAAALRRRADARDPATQPAAETMSGLPGDAGARDDLTDLVELALSTISEEIHPDEPPSIYFVRYNALNPEHQQAWNCAIAAVRDAVLADHRAAARSPAAAIERAAADVVRMWNDGSCQWGYDDLNNKLVALDDALAATAPDREGA